MKTKIIDLTFNIEKKMTTFPSYWHPKVDISRMGSIETEGRSTTRITVGSHTGTHVDAPSHFIRGGAPVDKLSLDILIGPAIIVDMSNAKPLEEIGVHRLRASLKGRPLKRLILRTDWSKKFKNPRYYTHYPFLSKKVVRWMLDNGLQLLAMDTPSPDNPHHNRAAKEDSPNHKLLLAKGVVLVEYLCNLKEITQEEVELVVLPLKIKNSDGSPARCIVIENAKTYG